MKLFYFSETGVKSVINEYKKNIGEEFYFDEKKLIKLKLYDILEAKSIVNNGFHVLFVSEKMHHCTIKDFMEMNNIQYNFENYDRVVYVDL
jgi:hypothetical protein